MRPSRLLRPGLLLAIFVALLLPGAYASAGGGGIPLIVTVAGCPAVPPGTDSWLIGDQVVPGGGSCVTDYIDGGSCTDPTTCIPLRVQLISNSKTLALDTRGTEGPRILVVHFGNCMSCASPTPRVPAGTDVHGNLAVPGLLEVLLSSPFPTSGRKDGSAKFWFTDTSGASWRIDWPEVEVSAVGGGWDIVPQLKAGFSEVAGLSLLTGQRTKPGTIGADGMYDIQFSLHALPSP